MLPREFFKKVKEARDELRESRTQEKQSLL